MVTVLLALVSIAVATQPLEAASHPADRGTVTVILDLREGRCAELAPSLRQEVSAVFRIPGLRISWRVLDESTPTEQFERLVLVRFLEAGPQEEEATSRQEDRLGSVTESHAAILPFVDIACDSVYHLVEEAIQDATGAHQKEIVGRACGRVLAHELYHILAQTSEHANRGIAKATFTCDDLLEPDFKLAKSSIRKIERAIPARTQHGSPPRLSFR
jgi:hypothetical protein